MERLSKNRIAERLSTAAIRTASKKLAAAEPAFAKVIGKHGLPPLWDREPGFATLLHIILEQQVSLASAKACFDKLHIHLGGISPAGLLTLDDAELRSIGFSRQKAAYARHLAQAVIDKHIDLDALSSMSDAAAKAELIKLKGVGEWTSDIYLLMVLLRPDIMPRGDIALHSAYHVITGEPRPSSDQFIEIARRWSPHRSTAARLLWHFYLSEKQHGAASHYGT